MVAGCLAETTRSSLANGVRFRPDHWPAGGFGHFVTSVFNATVVALVPRGPVLDCGATMFSGVQLPMSYPYPEFCDFATKHMYFATLTPGFTVSVPSGWMAMLATRDPTACGHVLHMLVVSTRLLHKCEHKVEVMEYAKVAAHAVAERMGDEDVYMISRLI